MTSRLLLSLHSPLLRSLLEDSEGTVTVCVPVTSETLASLVSLLTYGEVRVDGESVFYEEDEVSIGDLERIPQFPFFLLSAVQD